MNKRSFILFITGLASLCLCCQTQGMENAQGMIDEFNLDRTRFLGEEEGFQLLREPLRVQVLERYLGTSLAGRRPPRIAFAVSGGGDRAFASGMGFLRGAARTGLLQSATHISSLSGGAWLIIAILMRMRSLGWEIGDVNDFFQHFYDVSSERLSRNLVNLITYKKIKDEHPKISVCNAWGLMFTKQLLGDIPDHERVALSELCPPPTLFPFPLFSAALDTNPAPCCHMCCCRSDDTVHLPEYVEVNPLCTHCNYLHAGMLTRRWEALGGFPLSFFVGLFGSAYSVSERFIASYLKIKSAHKGRMEIERYQQSDGFLSELFDSLVFGHVLPVTVPSFLDPSKNMICSDGGHIANIDTDMLNGAKAFVTRAIDVIVICDSSAGGCDGSHGELNKMRDYALAHGTEYPSLENPERIHRINNGLVFRSEKVGVPSIIYFYNTIDVPTTRFSFPLELTRSLATCMEDAVVNAAPAIRDVILAKVR